MDQKSAPSAVATEAAVVAARLNGPVCRECRGRSGDDTPSCRRPLADAVLIEESEAADATCDGAGDWRRRGDPSTRIQNNF
jgi:hypothetical protein